MTRPVAESAPAAFRLRGGLLFSTIGNPDRKLDAEGAANSTPKAQPQARFQTCPGRRLKNLQSGVSHDASQGLSPADAGAQISRPP